MGGCIGDIFGDLISKYQEQVQTKSKSKQSLNLVKSFPGKDVNGRKSRRREADYYVIHTGKDGEIQFRKLNVSGRGLMLFQNVVALAK